jgi:hypothetical protein
MRRSHELEPVIAALIQSAVDAQATFNNNICTRRFHGPERIYERLFQTARFSSRQILILEYLLNEASEGTFDAVLSTLDQLTGSDILRLDVVTSDGRRHRYVRRAELVEKYALDWRARLSAIGSIQAKLATSIGIQPFSLDVSNE